ncbi:MAG: hypothetical protein PQJ59_16570 [Spirochaetales bacterium]|nr:hypothetical protein [Spirochaetales bacterium]
MSQIEEVNEVILSKILKTDSFYEALWGKEDFTASSEITTPNDYKCGAFCNALEYIYEYVRQLTSYDLDELDAPYLDVVVYFFTELKRYPNESNEWLLNRMKSLLVRKGDFQSERWGTPWDIKNVFSYYVDRDDLYYIPNSILTDEIVNGDFESEIGTEWTLTPTGDRIGFGAFTGSYVLPLREPRVVLSDSYYGDLGNDIRIMTFLTDTLAVGIDYDLGCIYAYTYSDTIGWTATGNGYNVSNEFKTKNNLPIVKMDDSTIAYASRGGSKMLALSFDGTDWTQVGNVLDLSDSDYMLPVIQKMDDLRYVVLDKNRDTVYAYDWDGTDWTQVGNPITSSYSDGYFYASFAVLNTSRIVVMEKEYVSGAYLTTYDFDGTDWTQVGNTLLVEANGQLFINIGFLEETKIVFEHTYYQDVSSLESYISIYSFDGTDWSEYGDRTFLLNRMLFIQEYGEQSKYINIVTDYYVGKLDYSLYDINSIAQTVAVDSGTYIVHAFVQPTSDEYELFDIIIQRDSDSYYWDMENMEWTDSQPSNTHTVTTDNWSLYEAFVVVDGSYNITITFDRINNCSIDRVEFGAKEYPCFELLAISSGATSEFMSLFGDSTEYENASFLDQDFMFSSSIASYSDSYYQDLLDTVSPAGVKGIFTKETRT